MLLRKVAGRLLDAPRRHLDGASDSSGLANAAALDGFEVELSGSGQVVAVMPGESILDALESAGVEVPNMCRTGICGTCATRVKSGGEHVVGNSSDGEWLEIAVCIARIRPGGRIALDL